MPAKKWSDKLKEAEKAPSFKELEEGTYSFVINDAGKVGSYNDVEQISINPAVEDGPRKGSRLFHNFNFPDDNPQVLRIVFEQLQALGLGEDYFNTEPPMEQVAQTLKGRRFTADVTHTKSTRDPSKTFVNLRNFKPSVSPAAMAGPGGMGVGPAGPGPAGPGGMGGGFAPAAQPAPQAPAQPTAQAPVANPNNPWGGVQAAQAPAQPTAQAPVANPNNPWGGVQAAQAPAQPAAQEDPWDSQQQQQQQQPPAQPQTQTWQPPAAPPLS